MMKQSPTQQHGNTEFRIGTRQSERERERITSIKGLSLRFTDSSLQA